MQTIIIPVSEKRPEDNILDLIKIAEEEFSDRIIHVSSALIVETDITQLAQFLKLIAAENGPTQPNGNGKHTEAFCISCGAPVSKVGKRCKKCAMKIVAKNKKRANEAEAEKEAEEL